MSEASIKQLFFDDEYTLRHSLGIRLNQKNDLIGIDYWLVWFYSNICLARLVNRG